MNLATTASKPNSLICSRSRPSAFALPLQDSELYCTGPSNRRPAIAHRVANAAAECVAAELQADPAVRSSVMRPKRRVRVAAEPLLFKRPIRQRIVPRETRDLCRPAQKTVRLCPDLLHVAVRDPMRYRDVRVPRSRLAWIVGCFYQPEAELGLRQDTVDSDGCRGVVVEVVCLSRRWAARRIISATWWSIRSPPVGQSGGPSSHLYNRHARWRVERVAPPLVPLLGPLLLRAKRGSITKTRVRSPRGLIARARDAPA